MKHTLSIFILILFATSLNAQIMELSDSKDTLTTSEGIRFIVGEDIKLGTGTMPNGDFKFVTPSRVSWTALTGKGAYTHVPSKFSGHNCRIKAIRKYGNKKRGYANYLMLGGGQAMNFECDIENALKAGEVVADGYTPALSRPIAVQQNGSQSLSDELRKLKKLKDDGILTEAEYEGQKQKLLAK